MAYLYLFGPIFGLKNAFLLMLKVVLLANHIKKPGCPLPGSPATFLSCNPAALIQDPWLSVPTSRWVWLSQQNIEDSQQVPIAYLGAEQIHFEVLFHLGISCAEV
jgi:hypothetical protein